MSDGHDASRHEASRLDTALALERLTGRVDLLAYKVEVLGRDREGLAPRPELDRVVAEVSSLKKELEEVLPEVRDMIRDEDTRRDRREDTLRGIIKWGAIGLLGFAVLSVLYALGLLPVSPVPR
jgi:hypothetical protein